MNQPSQQTYTPRFSVTQMLMGMALVAILIVMSQSGPGWSHLVERLEFSQDGSRLLVCDVSNPPYVKGELPHVSDRRTLLWLDAEHGRPLGTIHQDNAPEFQASHLARSAPVLAAINGNSESIVAFKLDSGDICQYAVDTEPKSLFRLKTPAYNLAVSPSGRRIAVCSWIETAVFDSETGQQMLRYDTPEEIPIPPRVAFSADETELYVADVDGLYRFDLANGKRTAVLENGGIEGFAVTPQNTLVVLCNQATTYLLHYDRTGEQRSILSYGKSYRALCVSPDGQYAACHTDQGVEIFSLDSNKRLRIIEPDVHATALAFSPDGSKIAVGSYEQTVTLFDTQSGTPLWTVSSPQERWTREFSTIPLGIWGIAAYLLYSRSRRRRATAADGDEQAM